MFYESGLFENFVAEMVQTKIPELQARVEQSVARSQMSERGRTALDLYMGELPNTLRTELNIGVGELIDATAQRSAHLFNAAEWNGIRGFFAEPEARSLFVKLSRGERDRITDQETAAAMRFFQTPSGQAYAARGEQLNAVLAAVMAEEMPQITARIAQRSFRHLCDALADECPREIRAQAGAPI